MSYNGFLSLGFIILLNSALFMDHASAVESDLDYLPDGQNYDPAIPKPEAILGYPVGTWHVRHDQVIMYLRALAEASLRQLKTKGR